MQIVKGCLFILSFVLIACRKTIEVSIPANQVNNRTVFSNDATAIAAMAGIYSSMMETAHFASVNLSLYTGLSADEFILHSNNGTDIQLYSNSLKPENDRVLSLWKDGYNYIYQANSILEGVAHATGMSDKVSRQLQGEAWFIRAFCHFYLLNLFGNIPLVTTTDYRVNASLGQSTAAAVYGQIIADLQAAAEVLQPGYVDQFNALTFERVRPNKWAAIALLARTYLYTGNWDEAVKESTRVIDAVDLYGLETDLSKVFLKESKEAIWQLKPVNPNYNTWEGLLFIVTLAPGTQSLSTELIQSFEPADKRFVEWIGMALQGNYTCYFPNKYKIKDTGLPLSEYSMVLRLPEIYLCRAEAQLQLGKIPAALSDLNIIRGRAGLPALPETSKELLMNSILHERRVELFTEWGHRWLDLKRTNTADPELIKVKGTNWQPTDQFYPIPLSEIKNDPHLIQNKGY